MYQQAIKNETKIHTQIDETPMQNLGSKKWFEHDGNKCQTGFQRGANMSKDIEECIPKMMLKFDESKV